MSLRTTWTHNTKRLVFHASPVVGVADVMATPEGDFASLSAASIASHRLNKFLPPSYQPRVGAQLLTWMRSVLQGLHFAASQVPIDQAGMAA